jgi:hypothetical protein
MEKARRYQLLTTIWGDALIPDSFVRFGGVFCLVATEAHYDRDQSNIRRVNLWGLDLTIQNDPFYGEREVVCSSLLHITAAESKYPCLGDTPKITEFIC